MSKVLSRPLSFVVVLTLVLAAQVMLVSPAHACHFGSNTSATPTADGFTFEAQWTTVASGNTGITGSVTAGSITWWLIDSYPNGDPLSQEPTSHGAGQGVRFVVSGLEPGQSATANVSALVGAFGDCSGPLTFLFPLSATGTALLADGVAPTFSAVTRTADGFTFTITNFDADGDYVLASTEGVVSRDGDVVTVSGLAPDTEATVTVTATKDGHTDAVDSITGSSLAVGTPPTFSAVTRTADGFTFTITNFDADSDYVLSSTAGTVTRDGDTVAVTGLSSGESATVTVTVTAGGATPASETVTASALPAAAPPRATDSEPVAARVAAPATQPATLPATGATTGGLFTLAVLLLLTGMAFLRLTARPEGGGGVRRS